MCQTQQCLLCLRRTQVISYIIHTLGKGKKGENGLELGPEADDSDSDEDALIVDEDGNVLPSKAEIKKYQAMKEGKRNDDSASEYRYLIIVLVNCLNTGICDCLL